MGKLGASKLGSWNALGLQVESLKRSGPPTWGLGAIWASKLRSLKALGSPTWASCAALGLQVGVLGASWEHFGSNAWKASSKQLNAIWETPLNAVMYCKNRSSDGPKSMKKRFATPSCTFRMTAKLASGSTSSLQVELPKALWAAPGAAFDLRKLCNLQETNQRPRASEVFPYVSVSPYD